MTTTPDGASTDAGPDNTSPDTQCPPRTEITATAHGGRTPGRCASIRGPQPDPQKQDKKAGTSPHTSSTATTKNNRKRIGIRIHVERIACAEYCMLPHRLVYKCHTYTCMYIYICIRIRIRAHCTSTCIPIPSTCMRVCIVQKTDNRTCNRCELRVAGCELCCFARIRVHYTRFIYVYVCNTLCTYIRSGNAMFVPSA